MTCHDARELFSALIDEQLTRGERADVYGHLATCADCRRELAAVERTVALVRGSTPARAPAGFVDRVVAAARPTPWYRRAARAALLPWPVKLPLGAAAVLLVGGLAVLLFRGTQEQQRAVQPRTPPPVLTDRRLDGQRAEPAPPPAPPIPPTPTARDDSASTDRAEAPERNVGAASRAEDVSKPAAAPAAPAAQAPVESREKSAGAKLESLRSITPPDVVATLRAPDVNTAERALTALTARLAGAQEGRRVDGDALIVELVIPRERYADFVREVARLGDYRAESEPASLPESVRLAVRLGS
jgi:hypothetical protein